MPQGSRYDHSIKTLLREKRSVLIVFLVIFSTIVTLTGGELAVHLFSKTGYLTPEILKNKSLQYERSVFARNAFPQREQKVTINNADIYINKKGYRGKDFEVKKPKGIVRIIFYGGSSVFDIEQSEGKDWPHRVETILHEKGYKNVEVINAGTPANKSFEAWGRLFAEGNFFEPDYVVLSDQYNDTKYFRLDEPILRQYNWFVDQKDPFITYQNFFDRFLCEHSQLYVRLRTKYFLWKYKPTDEGAEPPGEYSDIIYDSGLRQYKLSMETFVDLAKNIKAVPILIIEPRLVARNNTPKQKKRINYASPKLTHNALVEALEKTDQIVEQVGSEKKVIVIDAARELNRVDEYFVDHVHLSDKGSEQMARIVANEFISILKK